MSLVSKFVILSLIVTLFYFIGLLTFITDYEENKCDMTYMFEYPQFVKIKMPLQEQFPRYSLYAYSEGKLTERARTMKFEGIPVLFVPGNAGSYKQVRSLSSVALRKALNSRVGYHFDFFTLDLNGELSGLNGAVLDDQTRFLNHSLQRIINLYENRKLDNVPDSVVVIGHSMGGVIAQNLLDTSELINLLITLSSPHKRPTISLDSYTSKYYNQLSHKLVNYSSITNDKTLISIGGGFEDHLVNSWLTNSKFNTLNVITTAIPKVWLSADHACITWCKQFILTIIRALFDSVDLKTKQISTDPAYRTSVFKHHLLKNSGINIRWAVRYKVVVRFDDRGQWIEDIRRKYTVNLPKGTQNNQWHMIRIIDDPKHKALFIQANNLAVTDWIFTCTADSIRGNSRYCESGIHLSHLSKIAPTTKFKRRTSFIDLVKLKKRYPKITHVVVRILPTQEPLSINFDVHNPIDRVVNIHIPRWFSLSRTNVIQKTEQDAVRYEVHLTGLQHVIQAYLLYVEPIDCTREAHHATISLSVPWANHDSHMHITETLKKPLSIRLHGSRPSQYNNLTAKVHLTLDPTCRYTVTIRNSFIGMLSQFARFYSPLLVANIAAVILMSYRSQLISLEENKYCSLFQSSLSMSTKPYYLVTSSKLLSKILSLVRLPAFIPVPDTQILIDENIDFLILPLLLYVTSVGLTYLMSIGLWAAIIMNESTVHKLGGKIFSRTIGKSFKMSDWFLNAIHRVPCVVALTLLCLGLTTCGGLALCLGVCYYFLKLSQLGEDFVESLIYRHVKKIAVDIVKKLFKKIFKTLFKRFIKKEKLEAENSENSQVELTDVEQKNLANCSEKKMLEYHSDESKENETNEELINSKEDLDLKQENEQIINEKLNGEVHDNEEEIKNEKKLGEDKEISDNEQLKNKDIKEDKESTNSEINKIEKDNEINNVSLRKVLLNSNENDEINVIEKKTDNDEQNKNECETMIQKTVRQMFEAPDNSEMHFHYTLFLIWFLIAALNVPSVLTWAHNFKYNNILSPDPSAIFGIVLCACAVPLWQFELPKPNKRFYKEMGIFVYGMAMLSLIYAPLSLHRLSYILTATLVVTTIHQILAPSLPQEESVTEEKDQIDPIALIKEIKTKLE